MAAWDTSRILLQAWDSSTDGQVVGQTDEESDYNASFDSYILFCYVMCVFVIRLIKFIIRFFIELDYKCIIISSSILSVDL